jgi:hypothetical protein
MTYEKRYVVYETTIAAYNRLGNKDILGLVEVNFTDYGNNFESEQEAIEACIADGLLFRNLLIIPQIYITQ